MYEMLRLIICCNWILNSGISTINMALSSASNIQHPE